MVAEITTLASYSILPHTCNISPRATAVPDHSTNPGWRAVIVNLAAGHVTRFPPTLQAIANGPAVTRVWPTSTDSGSPVAPRAMVCPHERIARPRLSILKGLYGG